MNLQRVEMSHQFDTTCMACHRRIYGYGARYADLDGPPFKAYYCQDCGFVVTRPDLPVRTTRVGHMTMLRLIGHHAMTNGGWQEIDDV